MIEDDEDEDPRLVAFQERMAKHGYEPTRENYITSEWEKLDPEEWTPEHESSLPAKLQNWDLFKKVGGQIIYIGPSL